MQLEMVLQPLVSTCCHTHPSPLVLNQELLHPLDSALSMHHRLEVYSLEWRSYRYTSKRVCDSHSPCKCTYTPSFHYRRLEMVLQPLVSTCCHTHPPPLILNQKLLHPLDCSHSMHHPLAVKRMEWRSYRYTYKH